MSHKEVGNVMTTSGMRDGGKTDHAIMLMQRREDGRGKSK